MDSPHNTHGAVAPIDSPAPFNKKRLKFSEPKVSLKLQQDTIAQKHNRCVFASSPVYMRLRNGEFLRGTQNGLHFMWPQGLILFFFSSFKVQKYLQKYPCIMATDQKCENTIIFTFGLSAVIHFLQGISNS